MTQDVIYKIVWGVLFLIFMLIRIHYAKRNKANVHTRTEGKARERVLVAVVSIGLNIIPLIWAFSSVFQWADIALPNYARIAGVAIAIFSLWLFYEVHRILGRNWSPVLQIRKGHTITRKGPYKRIRHPMYTQIWIWVFAQLFITSNWFVGFAGIFSWSVLYFIRVSKEEKMMEEEFGDEYLEYKKQTGRIFPKF